MDKRILELLAKGNVVGRAVAIPRHVPEGYEVVGIDSPVCGQWFLDVHGNVHRSGGGGSSVMYVIVEKKRVQVGYTVRSLGRPPKIGEMFRLSEQLYDPCGYIARRIGPLDSEYVRCTAVEVVEVYND